MNKRARPLFKRTNFIIVIHFFIQALSQESKNLLIPYFIQAPHLFPRPHELLA